jgi:ABC-type bacteriocin/lantibiotic exporter with double-glycine peptidase domain
MIETLKASGAENGYFEQWSGYQASANDMEVRDSLGPATFWRASRPVSGTVGDSRIGAGGVFHYPGAFYRAGVLLAFQGFLYSFIEPVNSLVEAGQVVQEMRTDMERIEDVMKYPADTQAQRAVPGREYHKLSGALSMKNVTFGYSKLSGPLLENFCLELRPGTSVAFVGSSGCGKSTLAKLISGLYKPWSGEICFDGIPIGEISREVMTSSLAVVDQDITIFGDSIGSNLKMWDKSVEDFEMILAAKDALIHEDIMLRANGYNYQLTEGGRDFSGGQRQRMEIARILAHRLSTIRDCDEIFVLEKAGLSNGEPIRNF